jgi:hypothetical protein
MYIVFGPFRGMAVAIETLNFEFIGVSVRTCSFRMQHKLPICQILSVQTNQDEDPKA